MSDAFPIDPLLPEILASLSQHPRLVLEAPPGAGKTTRVPPALLDAPWLAGRKLLMLEHARRSFSCGKAIASCHLLSTGWQQQLLLRQTAGNRLACITAR